VAVNGQRTRIAMDISSAKEFHERLTEFCEFYSSLGIVTVLCVCLFFSVNCCFLSFGPGMDSCSLNKCQNIWFFSYKKNYPNFASFMPFCMELLIRKNLCGKFSKHMFGCCEFVVWWKQGVV